MKGGVTPPFPIAFREEIVRLVDSLRQIAQQITIEINATTDNPLFDVENGIAYQGGNFLGQYVGVAMDHLRYYIGLLAKPSGHPNRLTRRAGI